jgi:hypothetical protein
MVPDELILFVIYIVYSVNTALYLKYTIDCLLFVIYYTIKILTHLAQK